MVNLHTAHLSDLPGLVVASQQRHSVRPASFEDHQPGERLEAVVTAVYKVSHEDVVGVRWRTALSEELLQVVELSMDVSTHRHWGADGLDVGLFKEKITDQVAQLLQLCLRQILAVLIDVRRF